MSLLEVRHLKRVYTVHFGGMKAVALADIEFSVNCREYVAIMGEPGSEKATLLNILTVLDRPTSGSIMLDGKDMSRIPDSCMATYRRDNLGFMFQDFNLLGTFSIKDNIFLPMVLARKDYHKMGERLAPLTRQLEIEGLLEKSPYEVPGGRKQRTTAVRVLITKPRLLLIDEPTGTLDSRATDGLLRIFKAVNRSGRTVFVVTHSTRAVSHAGRVLFIEDGIIFHQLYHKTYTNEETYQKVPGTLTVLATRKKGEGCDEQRA